MRVRDVRSMRAQGHDGVAMNHDASRLVLDALRAGDIVGVFPEGGVHDGPSLGHFRAGVAQMVLNRLYRDAKSDVVMVPFGIQYEAPRRWRSDLCVVVGAPLSLRTWLTEQEDERVATGHAPSSDALTAQESRARAKLALRLRDRMREALAAVTRNSPSWETAEFRDSLIAAVAGVLASRTEDVHEVAARVQRSCAAAASETNPTSVGELASEITQAVARAGAMGTSPRDVARVLSAAGVRAGRPEWPSRAVALAATPLAAIGWLIHGPAFVAIWSAAQRGARDRTEYVARAFVPGLYLILCAYVLAGGFLAALLLLTSWSSWWAIVFVPLLPRLGDVAVWWRDSTRAIGLRTRVMRWPASERAALCLAADALRVAWHSHLASTVVHPAGHSEAPALTNATNDSSPRAAS
jgi:hypothetical protein